jgi:hypothetical protein
LVYQLEIPRDPQEVTKEYSNLLGVDFSNDDSQVSERRLSDCANVWRYYGAQGSSSIDTVVGFRKHITLPTVAGETNTVYGMFFFERTDSGILPVIHAGKRLYLWSNYPSAADSTTGLTEIYTTMAARPSSYFEFDNKLYINDGVKYLVYDGTTVSEVVGYIPTTKIQCDPLGGGENHQQRNLLSAGFVNTFVTDGTSVKYYLSEKPLDATNLEIIFYLMAGTPEVLQCVEIVENDELWSTYVNSVNRTDGYVEFKAAPPTAETCKFDAGYPTVEIKAFRTVEGDADLIKKCDITAVYDNRAWFAGGSDPSALYWSMLNDPSYIGQINVSKDGNSNVPIMGLIQVGEYLAVLKADTQQDATVYLHYPVETNENTNPKVFPSKQGIAKIGCFAKNACLNFRDDPVFVSRQGIEAIGKMNIGLERSIEHRSTRVDRKLTNESNLDKAVLETWYGYFLCLVNGHIYVADSRYFMQNNQTGYQEYEWFFWDEIGVYEGGYVRYLYAYEIPEYLAGKNLVIHEDAGHTVNPPDLNGTSAVTVTENTETINGTSRTWYTYTLDHVTYLVDKCKTFDGNELIGGTFKKAILLKEYDNFLYFGTENGFICKFNTDQVKDSTTGELEPTAYHFDNRAIHSSITTKFDDFKAYNILKRFKKRGNIVDIKAMTRSAIKTIVETEFEQWDLKRFYAAYFDFNDIDFGEFTFNTLQHVALVLKGIRSKRWKRAKLTFYSDEIFRPFGVNSIILIAQYMNYAKR